MAHVRAGGQRTAGKAEFTFRAIELEPRTVGLGRALSANRWVCGEDGVNVMQMSDCEFGVWLAEAMASGRIASVVVMTNGLRFVMTITDTARGI